MSNPKAHEGGEEEEEEEETVRASASATSTNPASTSAGANLGDLFSKNLQFTSKLGLGKMALAGFGLGLALAGGLSIAIFTSFARPFFLWTAAMAIFHWMEFFITCVFHPQTVSYTAFLFNPNRSYRTALAVCVAEYWVELLLFPAWLKSSSLTLALGVLMVVGGQALRSLAMWQAGHNFTHVVAHEKKANHQLVRAGVYKISRHPSYMGWFWWSLGTQVLLANPVCLVGYALVSLKFFRERIEDEEAYLVQFFGNDYVRFQEEVGVGIPTIK